MSGKVRLWKLSILVGILAALTLGGRAELWPVPGITRVTSAELSLIRRARQLAGQR